MTQISHDPFSRESIIREKVNTHETCSFCGQKAKWKYYIEQDSIACRKNPVKGVFCSIGCMRAYNS